MPRLGLAGGLTALVVASGLLAGVVRESPGPDSAQTRAVASVGDRLPLAFEPNGGRTDQRARFIAHGAGYTVFVTPHETVMALRGKRHGVVRTRLVGARSSEPRPERQLPGVATWRAPHGATR